MARAVVADRVVVTALAKNIVTARAADRVVDRAAVMAPAICIVTARATARAMEVATVHARVVVTAVVAMVADVIDNDRRDTDDISSS